MGLDGELRLFRMAAKKFVLPPRWLRRVREALGVTVVEIAKELGVQRSAIYQLEASEERQTISLRAMERVARAMECRVVYAVIPECGASLMEVAERRKWRKRREDEGGDGEPAS